ncbi:MAG: GntR family transcriptional regulator [Chitinivibrionales bacterium]|nr:GntR family transcriptional regulator [Chitinivibrionales bacterium]MBD3358739.1 GntR family transcriptional regulator [Chitinivibrionales bacterium]
MQYIDMGRPKKIRKDVVGHTMESSAIETLIKALSARIEEDVSLTCLGSVSELCRENNVSRHAAEIALDYLCNDGVIAMKADDDIRVVGRDETLSLEALSGKCAALIARMLEERIRSGELGVDSALPSVRRLSDHYNVPCQVLYAALEILAEEKVVRHENHSWIVGAKPLVSLERFPSDPPVMLVVGAHKNSWNHLGKQERTASFCRSFNEEVERNGFMLMPAAPNSRLNDDGSAVGLEGLPAFARELGDRYRGTLIAATLADIPSLTKWFETCIGLGRPVVWFDRYGREKIKGMKEHELFLHCRFDEDAALRLAVDFLARLGHRKAGYGCAYRWGGWERVRGERLQRIAPSVCPGFEFVIPPALERLGGRLDTPAMRDIVARFMQETSPVTKAIEHFLDHLDAIEELVQPRGLSIDHDSTVTRIISLFRIALSGGATVPLETASEAQKHFLYFTPLFLYLLQHSDLQAIVAPNDAAARDLYRWISAAGKPLGRELSLLSFDNYREPQPLPVTTIDFGFDNLGRTAFHFLRGDPTVLGNPPGHLPARPHVVRRGSVKPLP